MGLHCLVGDRRVDFDNAQEFNNLYSDVSRYNKFISEGVSPSALPQGGYYRCRFPGEKIFQSKFVHFKEVIGFSEFPDSQTIDP